MSSSQPGTFTITISNKGTITFIYDDDIAKALSGLGKSTTTRASHVEPNTDGTWYAYMDLVGGPTLGPFNTRTEALQEEVHWIEQNILRRK
jgi:hypothetical protein